MSGIKKGTPFGGSLGGAMKEAMAREIDRLVGRIIEYHAAWSMGFCTDEEALQGFRAVSQAFLALEIEAQDKKKGEGHAH